MSETGKLNPVDLRRLVLGSPALEVDCSVCDWQENEGGQWETDCSEIFEFNAGDPKDNGFEWCPYCEKKLNVLAYSENATNPATGSTPENNAHS